MPIERGKDKDGPYYQWGERGKRYHYTANDKPSREKAREKAVKQAQAAIAHGA